MIPKKPTVESLEKNLQMQIDRIDEAIIKIRQNVVVDIKFMEKEVDTLCKNILATKGAGTTLESKMIEMINRLDELATELDYYQNRVTQKQ